MLFSAGSPSFNILKTNIFWNNCSNKHKNHLKYLIWSAIKVEFPLWQGEMVVKKIVQKLGFKKWEKKFQYRPQF